MFSKIKDFLSKNFLQLVIIGLFVAFMMKDCGGHRTDGVPRIDTVTSVIYHVYQDTTKSQPNIIVNIPPGKKDIPTIMYPDGTYVNLKKQYDSLINLHYSKNIQEDSLKIDTFGYIKTRDTVYDNRIIGREWIKNIRIPERTNTITIHEPYKPVNQLYVGGGVLGSQQNLVSGLKAGVLFKNKNDRLYGVSANHIFSYGTVYELSYYQKLKLRK